ncbi:unnamed protein product [Effrenium voratum]|nr:unnamed protein product [Effrenium voratum]
MADESFKELLQKLERQHSNEVAILQKEIRDLKAKALVKLEEPKAVLGPKVEAPHSRCVSRENPNQAVPHEVDHRKPAGDLQDVESVDGAETNGNVNRISTSLEVPRTKPPQLHMGTVSSMGTASGSFSVSSPTGEPKDTPEAESKPKEPLGCMGTCEKWVKSDAFELAVAGLVALNFFTMAAEMQYEGLQIGYVLGHRWLTAPASEFWPGAATVFEVFRMVFLVAFSVEILVRVFFLRGQFCKTAFNIIDFSALLASIVELFSLNLPVDPTLLRLCRLAKLFRTIRVLRFSGMLDSLSMLARCMSSSGLTLVWSLVFLLVIQLIAAMMVCLMVKPYLEDASLSANPTFLAEQQAVYRYYGTFSIAVLTLFEVFFANWSPACRVLTDNISEWYSLLFLIYRCAIGFAVINAARRLPILSTACRHNEKRPERSAMERDGSAFELRGFLGSGPNWEPFEYPARRAVFWSRARFEGLCHKVQDFALGEGADRLRGPRLSLLLALPAPQADPEVWALQDDTFQRQRPLWNCGARSSQVLAVGFGPDCLYCSGADGTLRILEESTGRLVFAVASSSGNTTRVVGMPKPDLSRFNDLELLVLENGVAQLWELGEKASQENPPPLPQLECRLLGPDVVSATMTGRILSTESAVCDLAADLVFEPLQGSAAWPEGAFPAGWQQLQVRSVSRTSNWVPIGRLQFVSPPRVVSMTPFAAAANLVLETFEGLARYSRRTSEIDGTKVAVLDGDFEANITLEPEEAAIAMQSSPSVCRVTSTGPSARSYTLGLTWVTLSTARCGPINAAHPFPSMHRLHVEVSPNGVQWISTPRPISLFEHPHFYSMSPLVAAVHSPRWITVRGIGFPNIVGMKIAVEIAPGFYRQALRVNRTALRFRSPATASPLNASIWVTFGGSPARDTGFILRLVDSPTVSEVTPPAISVGDPTGTDTRRPVNVYGTNFRTTDECIFQSVSMATPTRVPLSSYISSTHVLCLAPGVALSDALVPDPAEKPVDHCEVYASLQVRINSLRDQVNAMKVEQLTRSPVRPGCEGGCEERNLTFTENGTFIPWYSDLGGDLETFNVSPGNMSSLEVSLWPASPLQVALEQEQEQLIFEAGVEYLKCVAQQASPTVEVRSTGGFLLTDAVWSPDLFEQPIVTVEESFPVRLLPRLGISSVTPDSGPVTGGTLIAVMGNGFTQQGRLSCAFDDNLYMPARYFNESLIYCDQDQRLYVDVAKCNSERKDAFGAHMVANRFLVSHLLAKKSTGFITQVAELPDLQLLPPPQIGKVEPEVAAVLERNDSSSVEPLLLRVSGAILLTACWAQQKEEVPPAVGLPRAPGAAGDSPGHQRLRGGMSGAAISAARRSV